MGDLLFVERHPYLPDGDPDKHRDALRRTIRLQPLRVVPGHGPIRGLESLEVLIRYIDDMEALGRRLAAQELSDAETRATPVLSQYAAWWFRNFFPPNTLMMTKRAREKTPKD